MKALKYSLTLVLGLSLSVCSARAFAQSSGQSQTVTPEHPNTLSEVPAANVAMQTVQQNEHRGIPTPKAIENLIMQGEYAQAVSEFEKFIKTAKGDPCDLIYLPYTFYNRLMNEDVENRNAYKEKADAYMDKYQKTCPNTVEIYMLQDMQNIQRDPNTTVSLMTKAIAVDSTYATLYSMRGEALWRLNRMKEACVDFGKAAQLGDSLGIYFKDMYCPESTTETSEE